MIAITNLPAAPTPPVARPEPVALPAGRQRLFAEAAERLALAGWHGRVTS